jgi:glucosyl-dolichyl phosphate glucuronosyltransferase
VMITVAICTWNRADLLDQTLESMRALIIPAGIGWEVIVVNNNCTDRTDEIIAKHAGALPLRRLFEPNPGQSNARNCAVADAEGDLLVWTDDDVIVDAEWLTHYVCAAQAFPRSAYFGGTVEPWFSIRPPRWIEENLDRLEGFYAIRDLGRDVRLLKEGEFVFGANMAVRTEIARRFPFDPNLGLTPKSEIRGDETEFQATLITAGYVGTWVGPAKVRHIIPATRLTRQYIRDWNRGAGRTMARIEGPAQCARLFGYPRYGLRKYLMCLPKSVLLSIGTSKEWLVGFIERSYMEGYLSEQRRLLNTHKRA